MLKTTLYNTVLRRLAALSLLAASAACADTLVAVTSASIQQSTDSLSWSNVGGDQTLLNSAGSVKTAKGATVQINLAGANSVLSKVCSATPCSWTGPGFSAGDTLLWTSDAGNGGNGPVRLSFGSGIAGAGAFLQADGPGSFTAKVEAFNGGTSLGYFTATSSTGRPVYIGLLDQTGPHVTSLVFSLATAASGSTTDFGLDTVNLTSAVPQPVLNLSPGSLTFPTQLVKTAGANQLVTLKNTGSATLIFGSIVVTGDFSKITTCGSSLAPGASCTISVGFHPTARGTRTGAITVTDNAPGSPHTVALSGTATAVKLSATKLTFAAKAVGQSSTSQQLTLTDVGSGPVNITSIAITGTNLHSFSETNTCRTSVAAGASCSINVVFQPKIKGALTANVTITDDGGVSPQQIVLTGTGQ